MRIRSPASVQCQNSNDPQNVYKKEIFKLMLQPFWRAAGSEQPYFGKVTTDHPTNKQDALSPLANNKQQMLKKELKSQSSENFAGSGNW